jgi:hypothetical protein
LISSITMRRWNGSGSQQFSDALPPNRSASSGLAVTVKNADA